MRGMKGWALAAAASVLAGHGHGQAVAPTVHEAMKDVVAVQAQILWDVSNGALDDDGKPAASLMSAEKWDRAAQAAAQLRASAAGLADSATVTVAAPGVKIQDADSPGAADAAQVQRTIDADRAGFRTRAGALAENAEALAMAATARDVGKFASAAEKMDEVCESCHMVYWYPQLKQ